MQKIKKQIILIVLDGWGYREEKKDNAIAEAATPFFDSLWKNSPHALLEASGLAVGLPEGQMGNSEVGHIAIGAGKIVNTDLVRIGKAIENGEFANNPAFAELFNHVKENDSVLHVQGLLGIGGVHSHTDHLYAFLKAAKESGVKKIALHLFTDGRDTAPQSAYGYLSELENFLKELGIGFIASASGRFYAMDRDNNWERLQKAEDALFECKGNICAERKPSEIVKELYNKGIFDEHIEPIVFVDESGKSYQIKDNDGVFFFNFRADRARMLSKKVCDKADGCNILFVTLTQYDKNFNCLVAFPPEAIETTLGNEISKAGFTQVRVAETEKFAHATYFLNGGREEPYAGEKRILIPSRKDVKTHDMAPKMRAEEIADKAIEEIKNGTDFVFINFANADMVGHTANREAIIIAIEELDKQLKRICDSVKDKNSIIFITADHGNAEINIDSKTGEKHTSHTTNPVPIIVTDKNLILHKGVLADIAPTILNLFGIEIPKTMAGKILTK
ncbi:MAG: phosphoglycerate mutase (2,3-diphosphoglycerate-independent) [Parcubacteria group bacterium]|nr:phosphoglycerate mutase (2,3-diphosphoglycerate-independent) [Parcubacteria group bacterium]